MNTQTDNPSNNKHSASLITCHVMTHDAVPNEPSAKSATQTKNLQLVRLGRT